MFLGHYGVALAAKKVEPKINLGWLFLACQFLDLIWPVFVLLGWEKVGVDWQATRVTPLVFEHYPYSHSLLMSCVWGALVGGVYFVTKRNFRSALVLGLVVFSHWVLDYLTHRPDLPLGFSDLKVGLGIWNLPAVTLFLEVGTFLGGIALYLRTVRPQCLPRKGPFWSLVTFLFLVYLLNFFGPKPPLDAPAAMVAGPALGLWLMIPWAFWADRKR